MPFHKKSIKMSMMRKCHNPCADPAGRGWGQDPPPGKSQVIWVSIGNKQLDPPPGKSWNPSGTLEKYSYL